MGPLAADELATLAGLSGRFRVLGRAELRELLAKQGIDPAGTLQGLSRPQGIPGLDCLLCGEVFDLSATNVEYDRRKLQRADLDVRVRIFSARSGALLYEGGLSGAAMVAPGSEGIRLLSGGNGDPMEVRVTKANQVEMIRSAIRKLFLLELPRIDEALSPK